MGTFRNLAGAALVGGLIGCAVPPPQMATPNELAHFGEAVAHAHDFEGVWFSNANTELQGFYRQALRDNPGLAAVAARKASAKAASQGALAQLLPAAQAQVVAGRKSSENGFMAEFQPSSYPYGSVGASWELPLFGRAQATLALSSAQVRQLSAREQSARLSLLADIYQAYARAEGALHRQEVLQRMLVREVEHKDALEALYSRRLVTLADLTAARKTAVETGASARAASADYHSALAALRALVAAPALTVALIEPLPAPTAPAPKPEWVRDRPDVAEAEAAVAEAAAAVGVARSEYWPQLTLGLSVSKTPGVERASTETVGLTIPLLSWFATRAKVNSRMADMDGSVFSYRETVLQAWRESQQAFEQLKVAEGQRADSLLLHGDALDLARGVGRAFDIGAAGRAERAQALTSADSAQLAAISSQVELHLAWTGYQKAAFAR